MAEYSWKGFVGADNRSGLLEADSMREAAHRLRSQGLIITRLEKQKEEAERKELAAYFKLTKPEDKKLAASDINLFTKKLSTMVRAGLTIATSLSLMVEQIDKPNVAKLCQNLLSDIETGLSFSEALGKYPNYFDIVYVNLVRAGEASGRLEFFLNRVQEDLEKSAKLRSSIKKAMFYPSVLLAVTVVVVGIMLFFVVPIFAQLFAEADSELPYLTQLVLSISDFIQDPLGGGLMLVMLFASVMGGRAIVQRNYRIRERLHYGLTKVPFIGDLIVKSALAKVAMIMSNLAAAGAPILDSVEIARSSVKNITLSNALGNVREGLYQGLSISTLFEEESVIPSTFPQLLAVGEETGNMEEMYGSLAGYYQEEVDGSVSSLTALLEPAMIVFMGLTVGFIIVAMYLPIFTMGEVLSG